MNTRNRRRVVRGGSWSSDRGGARASFRFSLSPGLRYHDFGFRVILRRLK